MKYRLYQIVDDQMIRSEFNANNVVPAMSARGFEFTGLNQNARHRSELQGAPKFAGVAGPTWDGDAIRYETADVYKLMSA